MFQAIYIMAAAMKLLSLKRSLRSSLHQSRMSRPCAGICTAPQAKMILCSSTYRQYRMKWAANSSSWLHSEQTTFPWLQPWSFSPSKGHSDRRSTNHECPDLVLAFAQHPKPKWYSAPTHIGNIEWNEQLIHPHGCIVSKLHSLANRFRLICQPWVSCFGSITQQTIYVGYFRCWDGCSCRM